MAKRKPTPKRPARPDPGAELQARRKKPRAKETAAPAKEIGAPPTMPKEIGGPKGPEPTRYGDWERQGRCVDF